jgi:cell division protein FtsZ
MRPDIGKQAAEEAIQEITEKLDGSHMLFVAAGMGGGTGTGAAPVIAKLARERGILTVGVVTKPFHFEGSQRMKLAEKGIEELQQYVDTLLTIPNQNLFRIANEKTTFSDAFKMADDVLYAGVRGVTDLMVQPGMINLDFSDIKTVMSEMGKAMMGTGEASGEGRAVAAAEAAIANPLIDDVSLKGARGLIINITGGKDITLYEVDEAANRIKQEIDDEANIIYGTTCDDRLDGLVRVSIVATGIDSNIGINAKPLETFAPININNDVYKSTQISESNDLDETVLENEFTDQGLIEEDKLDQIEVRSSELNTISSETSEEMQKDDLISESNIQMSESEEKTDENVEDKEEVLLSNSNIDNIEEEVYSDSLKTETESGITSVHSEDHNQEQVEEELLIKEEPSVRRLSLFDNISTNESEKSLDQEVKTEPVISENNLVEESVENLDKDESSENIEPEFNASTDELDEEFNQETEEELLDIPTFLRRQAN